MKRLASIYLTFHLISKINLTYWLIQTPLCFSHELRYTHKAMTYLWKMIDLCISYQGITANNLIHEMLSCRIFPFYYWYITIFRGSTTIRHFDDGCSLLDYWTTVWIKIVETWINKKKNVVELVIVRIKTCSYTYLDYNAFVDCKQTYKKILLSAAMLVVLICQ